MIADKAFDDDADDTDRWLYVHCAGSHDGYRDMESFIDSVPDSDLADRLTIAISGRGAFSPLQGRAHPEPDESHRYRLFTAQPRTCTPVKGHWFLPIGGHETCPGGGRECFHVRRQ
ncbi:hypothetical protein MLGJGCBP_07654 [Rhodococcus sp. T7]|uniref:Uncharacterized protein n=1 Tax=Rhodococcus opacus RKJ300 = JCM 13270 TaxID=1165867 RepID=I0WTZ9_RHOOP|nr:hypothetical protein [Rhodococcus opacus]EID79865.1 hypothetical protein W59_11066 [Rhodococcus opacus RKJ300 = JCM 13270]KAF0959220.1 hypothetical protein MLGJGCBP_07654 [Rhodococcus sp. T7]UOT08138.1 hypothetical protein MPY17_37925 [Rhodococcus opacus]